MTPWPADGHGGPRRRALESEGKELTRQALLRAALKLLSRNSFDSHQPARGHQGGRHLADRLLPALRRHGGARPRRSSRSRSARCARCCATPAPTRPWSPTPSTARSRRWCSPPSATSSTSASSPGSATAGSSRIRAAIRRELQLFADELAVDLAVFPFVRDWTADDRRMLASLIAETMIHMAAELLDADADEAEVLDRADPPAAPADQPRACRSWGGDRAAGSSTSRCAGSCRTRPDRPVVRPRAGRAGRRRRRGR